MNERQEQKQLTVQEALELTARNLEGIAGEVPMKMKGLIFDPMMAQVGNIRSCIEVLNQNAAKAAGENAPEGEPEGNEPVALFPEAEEAEGAEE